MDQTAGRYIVCARLPGCMHVKEKGVRRSGWAEWQVLILFLPPINPASTEGLGRSAPGLDYGVVRADGGRERQRWEGGMAGAECGVNERAFNFKNSVGVWIGAFVQSLVWLIRFEWRVFIGVSELATVLRSRHVQFKSTRESYLALGRAATKEVFFLTDYPLLKGLELCGACC